MKIVILRILELEDNLFHLHYWACSSKKYTGNKEKPNASLTSSSLTKIWLPAHQYANQPQEDKNIVVVVVLVLFLVANFSNKFVFYFPLSFIQFYHTLKQWKIKLKLFSHWQYTGPRNHESHTVHTCGAWTMTSVRRVRKIWTAFFKWHNWTRSPAHRGI